MANSVRLPLSAAQQGVWLAHQLDQSQQEFNCAQYLAIDGPIDVALFRSAWTALRAEADVARISSIVAERGLWQVVEPFTAADLPLLDQTAARDPEQTAQRWMREDLTRPVTLSHHPISTFALLKLGPASYWFYYRMHHVITDGYGVQLIGKRLAEIYTAMAAGAANRADWGVELAPLATLIDEDLSYRAADQFTQDREYWTRRFIDKPAATRLPGQPCDRADRPLRLSATGTLTRPEIDRLEKAAAATGTIWQIFVLAAVAAYTRRVTDRPDVILGMPVAGRRSAASRRLPGMATNSVALRLDIHATESLAQLAPRMAEEVRVALKHERYRAEDLRRDLGLEGSGRAFIGPMVNFMPEDPSLRFGAYPATTHNLASGPIVDFAISVIGQSGGPDLALVFEANPDHHDRRGFLDHRDRLTAFLAAVVADPARPIGQVDALLPRERHVLLVTRNATVQALPAATVPELFARQAARTPAAIALAHEGRTWTYAVLNRWADGLASDLVAQGIGPEDFVAIQLTRSSELIVAMLAVLKSGAAYVPIDPAYPAERIRYMIADFAPRYVITEVAPPGPLSDTAAVTRPVDPANPAYLIYTSGSTGAPKGVVVPHAAVQNFVLDHARRFALDGSSRVLQYVSPSFDVATGDIWPVLLSGGRLVLAPTGQTTTADTLLELLDREQITHASIPPAMLAQLPGTDLPHLAVLLTGGESLDPDVVRRWSPGRMMVNVYGVTEATVASTTSVLAPDVPAAIGQPIGNCQVYVLDSGLDLLLAGVTGQLYLAGTGLARGYLHRPALTAERFLPCPYGPPGSRMYASGDLVRWRPGGELEYHGRTDQQVKIKGFRVELGEVEAVLAGHLAVHSAVVVAREDTPGRKRLVAYVQPVPGAKTTPAQLRRFTAQSLPDYMVPAAVVLLDALPVTSNGKVDRRALPAPEPVSSTSDLPSAGSREATLCALFAEALGVERVGVNDSFFDLGGDSIMVFPLVSRALDEGLELTAREVFQHPTVATLAPVVRVAQALAPAADPAAVALTIGQLASLRAAHPSLTDVLPVSPLQEGFLFHTTLAQTTQDAYVSQMCFDLDGPFDPTAMRAAGEALLRRHPNLRVAFVYGELPEPVQVVCDDVSLPWAEADLSGFDDQERDAEATRRAVAERDRGFDMATPPLMRFLVLKLSDARHRLVLSAHHILWDGWSTSILIRELFTLYARGSLPPITPYPRYLDWLAAQDLPASRRAWSAALSGLAAPTLVAAGFTATGRQEQVRYEMSAELTKTITEWARSNGLTTNTVAQGAWAATLSQLTGLDDVVFGSSVSGRPPHLPGIEKMVGLLTNTVPVRLRMRSGEPPLAMLTRLQAEQADLIPHHYLGLADIQRQSSTGTGLFDSVFMFVNYSFDPAQWTAPLHDLKLAMFEVEDDTHYPLRLAVVPGPRLHLRLGYHPGAFRRTEAERLMTRLVTIFETIATGGR